MMESLFTASFFVGALLGALVTGAVMYFQTHSMRSEHEADERRKRFFHPDNAAALVQLPSGVSYSRDLHLNSRGMVMASQMLTPSRKKVSAVVGMCHGFGDHVNDRMMDLAIRLVGSGYAVLMMDVEGHGLSDGLHGCLHDLQQAAIDLSDYFVRQVDNHSILQDKPFFLYGISMGGAMAFHIGTLPQCAPLQEIMSGVILCAPMVKVSDELKPPQIVIRFLSHISKWIPLAPITPVADVIDRCLKDPVALLRARNSLLGYKLPPRLQTALTLLNATEDISKRMHELDLPLLILHGGDDTVTCPKLSAILYEQCSSEDKTLRIYPGCWHDMFSGESQEQMQLIYADMTEWMRKRWK